MLTTEKFKKMAAAASRATEGDNLPPYLEMLRNGETEISPHAYDILKLAAPKSNVSIINNKYKEDLANGATDRYGRSMM